MWKSTWRNLSKSGDRRSWKHSTKEDKIITRGCHVTNDQSESTLGGTTRGIELGRTINIHRAADQSDARRNGFWSISITTKRGKKKNVRVDQGTFHKFCDKIQHCLIYLVVEDSHEQDTINDRELGDHRRSKREKDKIIVEKGLKKEQKNLINAIYCYQMYFSSSCAKDDPKLARKIVKELSVDAARFCFLCRNIEI